MKKAFLLLALVLTSASSFAGISINIGGYGGYGYGGYQGGYGGYGYGYGRGGYYTPYVRPPIVPYYRPVPPVYYRPPVLVPGRYNRPYGYPGMHYRHYRR